MVLAPMSVCYHRNSRYSLMGNMKGSDVERIKIFIVKKKEERKKKKEKFVKAIFE